MRPLAKGLANAALVGPGCARPPTLPVHLKACDLTRLSHNWQGHYVPAVAHRVYRAKELGIGEPVNIVGAAIGNGLTMPAIQYGA